MRHWGRGGGSRKSPLGWPTFKDSHNASVPANQCMSQDASFLTLALTWGGGRDGRAPSCPTGGIHHSPERNCISIRQETRFFCLFVCFFASWTNLFLCLPTQDVTDLPLACMGTLGFKKLKSGAQWTLARDDSWPFKMLEVQVGKPRPGQWWSEHCHG